MRLSTLIALLAALPGAALQAQPADGKADGGVLVRIFDIGQPMSGVPELAPGQLPNAVRTLLIPKLDNAAFTDPKENLVTEMFTDLSVDMPGVYGFRLISDDGSKLWINGKLVINHDGPHGPQPRDGNFELAAGTHRVYIRHYQGGGDAHLELQWRPSTAGAGAKFGAIPATVLRMPADVARETAPGKKRIVPPLRRGRPGDGAPVAARHPGLTPVGGEVRTNDEFGAWPTDGRLRVIGAAATDAKQGPLVWLPSDDEVFTPGAITVLPSGVYGDQLAVWPISPPQAPAEAKRVYLDKVGDNVQGCVFRFSTAGATQLKPSDKTPLEMRRVRAMGNGLEIELTQPLMEGIGWETDSYYVEQWPFDAAAGKGPARDGSTVAVKSVSVSPERQTVFLEIPGLKPGNVVYVRMLPPFLNEKQELPWTTEAWYTLNTIPTDREGQVFPRPTPAPQNVLTEDEKKQGWKLLFDGKTTQGWHGFKKQSVPDGWKAIDGCLVRAGPGGDIVTDEEFGSFEFAFEWRVSQGGNSGVFYGVSEDPKFGAVYATGPEYQVLDNSEHNDGKNTSTSAGANYALHAPTKDVTRPVGLFNQGKIVVRGDHVEHWLNGEKIVEYEWGSPEWQALVKNSKFNSMPGYGQYRTGRIALQDHGDRVWYRNLKIRKLAGSQ